MRQSAHRPRVVLDCNVVVQAISNQAGPAGQVLRLLQENRIEVCVSRDTDLLSLATARSLLGKQFRQRYPRLRVLNPVAFLAIMAPGE